MSQTKLGHTHTHTHTHTQKKNHDPQSYGAMLGSELFYLNP